MNEIECKDCVYGEKCPCGWSYSCAACLTIRKKTNLNGNKMKTIEEMIAIHTREEWQKIIKNEMNKLGLCFSKDTEYQKENLFDD